MAEVDADPKLVEALRASRETQQRFRDDPGSFSLSDPDRLYLEGVFRFIADVNNRSRKKAAGDSILAWWSADPTSLTSISIVFSTLDMVTNSSELMTVAEHPLLCDTTNVAGLFLHARTEAGVAERYEIYARIWERRGELSLLDRLLMMRLISYPYQFNEMYEEGVSLLLEFLPELHAIGTPTTESLIWMKIALHLRHLGRPEEAKLALYRAIELADEEAFTNYRYTSRLDLACLFSETGATDKALSLFRSTLAICEQDSLQSPMIICQQNLSSLYVELGEFGAALDCDERTLSIALSSNNVSGIIYSYLNITDDKVRLADLEGAWEAIREARRWGLASGDDVDLWAIYTEESDLWLFEGEYHKADSLTTLAREIGAGQLEVEDEILSLFRLVQQAREMGRIDSALEALFRLSKYGDSAIQVVAGVDFRFESTIEMALLRIETGEFDMARQELRTAAERLAVDPAPERHLRYQHSLGLLLAESRDQEGALVAFQAALKVAEELGSVARISHQKLILARQLLVLHRVDEAARQLEEVDGHLDRNSSYRTWQLKRLLEGQVAAARGRYGEAGQLYRETLSEASTTMPLDLAIRFNIELATSNVRGGEPGDAMTHFKEAARLLHEVKSGADSEARLILGNSIRDCYHGWIALLLTEGNPLQVADPPRESLNLYLELLALERGFPTPSVDMELPNPLLAILPLPESSILWAQLPQGLQVHRIGGTAELETLTRKLWHALSDPRRQWRDDLTAELATHLLTPLRGQWPAGTALHVLPAGSLRGLPWSVLPWQGGQVLDHAPVVEFTPITARYSQTDKGSGDLLAVGFNGGKALAELRHAEQEATEIAGQWPVGSTLLLGDDSARLPELLQTRLWGALHLAMHAEFTQGVADRACLVLPEGQRLGVRDILASAIPCELVYLSSCVSAHGALSRRGGGLDLVSAFHGAGARNLIASALPVSDRAARDISRSFYRHWRDGEMPAQALWRACRELRDGDVELSHPHYWATWRLSTCSPH